jgi:hypothetical protein
MIRSALSKVVWMARATTVVVGVAIMLGLIFGVATSAFGANGGNFILGSLNNTATAITKLTGTVGGGPALHVSNPSTATGSRALDLQVATGKAPMRVNSGTKVTNLNADKLDGKEASAFASYTRTVVVTPVGTDTQNGTALLNALAGITDASQTKKYLLYVEPGTYNLGSSTLQMKQHVDIQGSGEGNTLITSSTSATQDTCAKSTVLGANDAELRFLTVRNTGTATTASCVVAVLNVGASPRLTHVTALATASQSINIAVLNSNSRLTMTNVTAAASGGTNIGVRNVFSSPTIKQSTLSGSFRSLLQESTSANDTAKVALTQLVGSVAREGGTLQCFNNYDDNLGAVSCP